MVEPIHPELPPTNITSAISFIMNILGEPKTDRQSQALVAFQAGDYACVQRISLRHPQDHYCQALSYLSRVQQLPANATPLLSEAIRATANHIRDGVAARLGTEIARILETTD